MIKKLITITLLALGASNVMAATSTADFSVSADIPLTCVITKDAGSEEPTIEFGAAESTLATFSVESNSPDPVTYNIATPTTNFKLLSGEAAPIGDKATGFALIGADKSNLPTGSDAPITLINGIATLSVGVETDLETAAFKAITNGAVTSTITITCPDAT